METIVGGSERENRVVVVERKIESSSHQESHDEYPQLRQLLRFIPRENFPRIWSEEGEEEKEDGPGVGPRIWSREIKVSCSS